MAKPSPRAPVAHAIWKPEPRRSLRPIVNYNNVLAPLEPSTERDNSIIVDEVADAFPKLQLAVAYSFSAHAGQVRKGTSIPYVSHLLAVAAIVLEHGGDEDLACAALLHDIVEDCGAEHEDVIQELFGERIARIVSDCSDTDVQPKPPWLERKRAYLAHLEHADQDTLVVSCADKLHNARAIVGDLRAHGPGMLARFNAPSGGTQWYYRALSEVFQRRLPGPIASELTAVVEELEDLAGDR